MELCHYFHKLARIPCFFHYMLSLTTLKFHNKNASQSNIMITFNEKYFTISTTIRNSASCVTTRDVTVSFSMRENSLSASIYPKVILQVAQQDQYMKKKQNSLYFSSNYFFHFKNYFIYITIIFDSFGSHYTLLWTCIFNNICHMNV